MGTWLNTLYPGKVTLDNEAWAVRASQTTPGTHTRSGLSPGYPRDWRARTIGFSAGQQPRRDLHRVLDERCCRYGPGKQPFGITLEMLRNNLQTMINQINTWATAHHKPVDIVLQTMNNESGGLGGARPNLPAYYQVYRDVAKANGLLLVDNYPRGKASDTEERLGKRLAGRTTCPTAFTPRRKVPMPSSCRTSRGIARSGAQARRDGSAGDRFDLLAFSSWRTPGGNGSRFMISGL